ncbi:MAG: hypothetical protein L0H31_02900 [Nocardioidaceae bacterium]|nr:hypothetical protein [Nocardioidaceae bacterium]
MRTATSRRARRLVLPWVSVLLLAAALSACGGSDEEGERDPWSLEVPGDDEGDTDPQTQLDDADASGTDQDGEVKPIEFLLPQETVAASGFQTIPAQCDTESDANEYRARYAFAVPTDWEAAGITGGSGSPLDEGTTVQFGTGSDRASVDVQSDTIQPDGIGDGQGGIWTTFDYDYTSGGTSGTVKYEEFATVPVADQDVTIWAAPQEQAPEMLRVTEYKARIEVAHLYGLWLDGSQATPSIVVTIKPTEEAKELDEAVVSGIVGSFALTECGRQHVIVQRELSTQRDVDGDGYVSTAEDYRELLAGDAS